MRALFMIAGALGISIALSTQAVAQLNARVNDKTSQQPLGFLSFAGPQKVFLSRFHLDVATQLQLVNLEFFPGTGGLADFLPDFVFNILDSNAGNPGTTVVDTVTFTYEPFLSPTWISHVSGTVLSPGTYFVEAYRQTTQTGGIGRTTSTYFIDTSFSGSVDQGLWSPSGLVDATQTMIFDLQGIAATQGTSPPTGPSGGSTSVPEPVSLALFGAGLTGLACVRRRYS